jgi:hypothetical protein
MMRACSVRALRTAAVAVMLAIAVDAGAAITPTDPDARVLRVERWLKAVLNHNPGAKDDAVDEISLWSGPELRVLYGDIVVLAQLMQSPARESLKIPDVIAAASPSSAPSPRSRAR